MCRRSMCFISFLLIWGLLCAVAGADPFQQDPGPDGIVSIEAEDFDNNVPQGNHTWDFITDTPGFSGTGAMRSMPDSGTNHNADYVQNSPRLDYEVNFLKKGTIYVWVRAYKTGGNDDSLHSGLDGQAIATADRIQVAGANNTWTWTNGAYQDPERIMFDVPSAGVHTFNIWMREDGSRVDKIVLTTNPDYTPTGLGPMESSRGPRLQAYGPTPEDGAMYTDTWVSLSWSPGETAASHDVYLGDNFDDVNGATPDSNTFRGNQTGTYYVAGLPGYAYPDGLVPGTTYYWRIDEVNDADPNSPWKGPVWSFSIPPKTAYNPAPADGAESVAVDTTLTWTAGFQTKLHYVYLGDNFDDVNSATVGMPQGTTTYTPSGLKKAKTYYWRVDEFDGAGTYKGDVWSFTTEGAVRGPNPANGAVDVKPTTLLTWTAGAPAASHEVYFGTDADAVKNATKISPEYKGSKALGDESYDPGKLDLETSYYWRIDEVNAANADSPWKGNVWSFTTGDFYVIDDFESYTDDDANNLAIWQTWVDGFGVADNGAQVGYLLPPYAEQTIVHGGGQSMPLLYNNAGGVTNSEASLAMTVQRDWTQESVANLSLWFRGNPGSVGSFVEGPVGTYTMTATGADIWNQADQFHFAYKMLTGVGSIQAKVLSVDNTDPWAKAGVMIRETLDAGSKFAAVYITPGNGCRFQARTDTDIAATSDSGVVTTQQTAITAPYWVKLERDAAGNFRGYYSSDGTTWTPMSWNPQSIAMSSNVYVGLALTAHNANATCTAKFSNVQMTGTVGPQWADQDIGIASNATEPLYVAVSNSTGSPAIVTNPDPNAATTTTWTQWVIPLSQFSDQGINLSNVDKFAIGLGTKGDATAAGGSGMMYFDDVRLDRPKTTP
jgi:Gylcosyl hydrolase family 115 C-terminal domain